MPRYKEVKVRKDKLNYYRTTHLRAFVLLVDSISVVVVEEVAKPVIKVVRHTTQDRFMYGGVFLAVLTSLFSFEMTVVVVVCLFILLGAVV